MWALSAIGVTSLISKGIEKWAERSGYLDDPTKGVQWLISTLAKIPELPGFYPITMFLVGLTLGLWLDRLYRSFSDSNETDQKNLGYQMLSLGEQIGIRSSRTVTPWPDCVSDLVPELWSLVIRIEKAGLWAPGQSILLLSDDGHMLCGYLAFVGRLLADGHFVEARNHANRFRTEYEQTRVVIVDKSKVFGSS